MKRLTACLYLAVLSLFVFSGCSQNEQAEPIPDRIVTGIDIYCQKPTCTVTRHYTQPEKIEAVLTYLRLLRPIGPVTPTEEARQGDLYEIVVHLNNGSHRIHRQQADSFAITRRPFWGAIDKQLGNKLPFLMALLPSDDDTDYSPN